MRDKAKRAANLKSYLEKHPNYYRDWYTANIEERRAYARAYCAKNPERVRINKKKWEAAHTKERKDYWKKYNATHPGGSRMRYRRYKLSKDQYDAMLKKQGGACAICKESNWNGHGPHVDHNHTTGNVRGILCHNCNCALGMIKDSPIIAKAMIVYIETSEGL